ncbi:MAG: insulinase family protein [Proteobacteria bacterium]|nr:insulinase family protein [Pseudomonadota bacterium]MCG2824677.1 insulinase family protein [Desulfobulbaceae bacterium]MDP2002033.1 pitrilysin family protein [Desulfurivibrionaceae bacterium]MBU4229434.1 insulinase family protein [Pseudomonadota bacterium]MBU4407489.1 insulinase family protein [Pseudomonadota bacterium]
MANSYQKTVLDNGIRIITEKISSRTVSAGIWVDVGARDEQPDNNGSAHFVEHMLFKGTPSRTAREIAQELDTLGGMSNAFTSGETTSYYATVLDDQLERLVGLMGDIFLNSLFEEEEVVREREVVLQEISMVEDTPDDRIHEMFTGNLWGEHPLGYTVLGRREVVAAMDSNGLREYMRRQYTPERIVIAASGNVEHEKFCRLWQQQMGALAGPGTGLRRQPPTALAPVRKLYKKNLEQAHLVLGTYGLPIVAPDRYALYLLHVLLGGNMSSRLFQEVREKEGLAYSIYSYLSSFTDSGYLGVYLGVDPAVVNKAMAVVSREIKGLRQGRVSSDLLDRAKNYAKAGIYLSAENMESRMTRIARNELTFGRYIPFEEVAAGFDQVRQEDIGDLAGRLFSQPLFATVLGPLKAKDIDWRPLDLE